MNACVITERRQETFIVTINRSDARNAVDEHTAQLLHAAFTQFEADDTLNVAVLTGAGGHFCAGADLKSMGDPEKGNAVDPEGTGRGPMGPTRLVLSKPVIAAVEGFAVAGGLELALWCDLRIAANNATFGVFCRRFGVPLIDGGTVRLPRLIGESRAMDMILTGRSVTATEAYDIGLANRIVEPGTALPAAIELASQLSAFPQACLRTDRASARSQWQHSIQDALQQEAKGGYPVVASEALDGALRFSRGEGRHGQFSMHRKDGGHEHDSK